MPRRRPLDPPSPPTGTPRVAALRLLGRRDYTRTELTTRLIDRGYAQDDVEAAIDTLVADRAIDDRRTAFAHVRTAARIKGRGRLRIARELERRGIAKDLIREALAELPKEDERQAIARFIERKRLPAKPSPQERRRIFGQLVRRGFPIDAVMKALGGRAPDDE